MRKELYQAIIVTNSKTNSSSFKTPLTTPSSTTQELRDHKIDNSFSEEVRTLNKIHKDDCYTY
ncbi:12674_t:CDS:1, partial [Acaulospora morrowiae]